MAGPEVPNPYQKQINHWIYTISHALVLLLSMALIFYISYDTFKQIPFLSNHHYMQFQLWVCILFLGDFFIGLVIAPDKGKYFKHKWFFLIISIPYLNIINQYNITFSADVLYYLRFVPLLRGAYALAMVMGYFSQNRAVSLLWQYIAILVSLVYCLALIFYYQEHSVNPDVKTFWDALYWAAMNMTTVGCYFHAVTYAGKIISVILPIGGMLILPVFTVFITDLVKKHNSSTPIL